MGSTDRLISYVNDLQTRVRQRPVQSCTRGKIDEIVFERHLRTSRSNQYRPLAIILGRIGFLSSFPQFNSAFVSQFRFAPSAYRTLVERCPVFPHTNRAHEERKRIISYLHAVKLRSGENRNDHCCNVPYRIAT